MLTFVKFAAKFHHTVVKRIGQNSFDFIQMRFVTGLIENFVLVKKFADISIPIAAGSKKLKSFLHILGSLFINFNLFVDVQVTKLRLIWPLATAEFLSITPFYILGKIIY